MLRQRFVTSMLLACMMAFGAGMVCGQTTATGSGQTASTGSGQAYPNKPIRIVTGGAGSAIDLITRIVAQVLVTPLGQPVIVDNRASSLIGELVAKAPPDGYTLLITGNSFLLAPLLQNMPYDPVRDFSPITWMTSLPNILVVNPSLPVKSVKELIALAKTKPGELNYASSGTGSGSHLSAELFKSLAGVNIVRINYKGSAPGLNALISNEVQVMIPDATLVTPYLKAGKLRALAVTSAQPSALAPGLPTVAASGVPGYESGSGQGILAPAKTSAMIINRLNQEFVRVINSADIKEKFFNLGVEAVSSSPEDFAAKIKSELARWGKVIKDAGIKAE